MGQYLHKLPHVSLPPSLALSLPPSLPPSIHPSIHLYIYTSLSLSLSLYVSLCLPMSLHVSLCLSMSLSLSLSLSLYVSLCLSMSLHVSLCLSMSLYVSLSLSLSLSLTSWIILQTTLWCIQSHESTWIPHKHRHGEATPRHCATLCHASSTSWRLRTRSKRPMWRPLAVSCQAFTKRCSKSCSDRKKTLLLLLGATSPGKRLWKSVAGRLWKSVSWWIVWIFEYDLKKTSLETRMKTILRYSIGRYP